MAGGIERDAFGVAIEGGFHADELRVHIIGGRFGHSRESVWGDAGPGTDADVDTFCERVRTEIRAPGPASHVDVDKRTERVHADLAITAQDDRLDVAGVYLVDAHQFGRGIAEIVKGHGQVHAVDLRGVNEPLHVLAKAKNGGTLLGFIAADAFEYRGAVAHDV